ncbi:MAG: DUF1553 domain-containing protein, partial [Pirellulales bacterium]|nr:DUF1553 domain-containing protein [Pirellulales bacterium]
DFGIRASPPSHPELLAWLAARFVSEGWPLSQVHRWILLSDTFQQSSHGHLDPTIQQRAIANDPDNRLLWRMNLRRLSWEQFRDSMLVAAEELDLQMGGKPVKLFQAPYPQRRTLYGLVDRQFLPSLLRTFDFASPDLHTPKRTETTVPQQALFFMNDPMVVDRARAIARSIRLEVAPATHNCVRCFGACGNVTQPTGNGRKPRSCSRQHLVEQYPNRDPR